MLVGEVSRLSGRAGSSDKLGRDSARRTSQRTPQTNACQLPMTRKVRSTELVGTGKPSTDQAHVDGQSVEAPIAIHTAEWPRG